MHINISSTCLCLPINTHIGIWSLLLLNKVSHFALALLTLTLMLNACYLELWNQNWTAFQPVGLLFLPHQLFLISQLCFGECVIPSNAIGVSV